MPLEPKYESPQDAKSTSIFIAHMREDKQRISPFIKIFLDVGFSIITDNPDDIIKASDLSADIQKRLTRIPIGANWQKSIQKGVEDADIVLAFWSKKFFDGRHEVYDYELYEGLSQGKLCQCTIDEITPAEIGRPYNFEQIADLSGFKTGELNQKLNSLIKDLSGKALKSEASERKRTCSLNASKSIFFVAASLFIAALGASVVFTIRQSHDFSAMVKPFTECQSRIVFPTAIFNEVTSDRHPGKKMLVHRNGEARVHLSAWKLDAEETIPSILANLANQAPEIDPEFPKCWPKFPACESDWGTLSGYYSSSDGEKKEFYIRLKYSTDRQFIHLYEMVHPALRQFTEHLYWDVNELMAATLKNAGKVTWIENECARKKLLFDDQIRSRTSGQPQ